MKKQIKQPDYWCSCSCCIRENERKPKNQLDSGLTLQCEAWHKKIHLLLAEKDRCAHVIQACIWQVCTERLRKELFQLIISSSVSGYCSSLLLNHYLHLLPC